MDELDTPNVLAVGAKLANLARAKALGEVSEERARLSEVDSAKAALNLLRAIPFDVVAVGTELTDATATEFAERLQRHKPWQKWLIVSDDALGAEDETTLRSLGALAILDGPDAWKDVMEIAGRLRSKRPATTVPGLQLGSSVGAASR